MPILSSISLFSAARATTSDGEVQAHLAAPRRRIRRGQQCTDQCDIDHLCGGSPRGKSCGLGRKSRNPRQHGLRAEHRAASGRSRAICRHGRTPRGAQPRIAAGRPDAGFLFCGTAAWPSQSDRTEATLTGATADALHAFHDRWYRPDRTVVAISGDADPAVLIGLVKKHFSSWPGRGRSAPYPRFRPPKSHGPRRPKWWFRPQRRSP